MRTDPMTPIYGAEHGGLYCADHIGVNPPASRLTVQERFAYIKAFGTTTLCETCRTREEDK